MDSVVGTGTRLRLEDTGFEFQYERKIFLICKDQTVSGAHIASQLIGIRFFPGLKLEVRYSPRSSARAKNEWSCTSTLTTRDQ